MNHVVCTYENADQEIYKDLMPAVYFSVSKFYLTSIFMKEISNTGTFVNVESDGISNELRQNLSKQIYPNFAQNTESESISMLQEIQIFCQVL